MKSKIVFGLLVFFVIIALPRKGVLAQYPTPTSAANDCSCLANGNCSDAGPGGGFCRPGNVYNCNVGCPVGYRSVEQVCSTKGPCGAPCVLEQSCATGFCQDNFPTVSCDDADGSFLCGDSGCNGCQRQVKVTTCNGSFCQSMCSTDPTCGVGCGGSGGGGPTATPGGGGGPTCNVTLTPVQTSVAIGASQTYTAAVSNVTGGVVSAVRFSTSNATIGPVCTTAPCAAGQSSSSDATAPYRTAATGRANGTTSITSLILQSLLVTPNNPSTACFMKDATSSSTPSLRSGVKKVKKA